MKRRYFFSCEVQQAEGFQEFYVDAKSKEEAEALVNDGGGEFSEEEVLVTSLGEPIFGRVEDIE
jgi:hypothetical protein